MGGEAIGGRTGYRAVRATARPCMTLCDIFYDHCARNSLGKDTVDDNTFRILVSMGAFSAAVGSCLFRAPRVGLSPLLKLTQPSLLSSAPSIHPRRSTCHPPGSLLIASIALRSSSSWSSFSCVLCCGGTFVCPRTTTRSGSRRTKLPRDGSRERGGETEEEGSKGGWLCLGS